MYIHLKNQNHPESEYFITDKTQELNLPSIPSSCSFVFKEKYTNKTTILSDDQFISTFENNHLLYNISIFNEVYNVESGTFNEFVLNNISNYSSNILFKITDNEISFNHNIMDFTNYPENYYTKNEVNNELTNISGNIQSLENKISSLEEVSKKEEIESELTELEQLIRSLNS